MELEMELDSEKSSVSDLSPNTVLPHRRCSEVEKRSVNGKLTRKDDILRVREGYNEISFRRYRSSSCKNVLSRPVGSEGHMEPKRGSMYQSSREVRRMKEMGSNEGRRKIELSRASDTAFSFRIVNSLHSLDEETMQKRSPASSNLNLKSVRRPCIEPCSSDDFIEICPNLDKREKHSAGVAGRGSIGNPNFKCEQVVGPLNDGNELMERDTALTSQKSLYAKLEMPCSPSSSSESYLSKGASSKSRFSPMRMMFDPFTKSKSLRSPLSHVPEPSDAKTTGVSYMRRNQTFRKYLFHDFSHIDQKVDFDSQVVKKDYHHSDVACSPVHLHGRLKLENKHGAPFFEFSLNFPDEVLVAKTWKANNAFNWVYTFHSISSRKKSNAAGWGLTDGNKESLVVGQMQVSYYFSSELKDGGNFDNSMVTEFVMYDIAHARHRVSTEDSPDVRPGSSANPGLVGGSHEMDANSDAVKLKQQPKNAFDRGNFDSSNPYPWASAVLHPDLEIAAIVIQLPFSRRESLKYKRGDKVSDEMHSNLLNLSVGEQRRKTIRDKENPEKVRVVIPTGNHSLPSGDSRGPSSLLDRWRSGGGCDCGGWDMACPLTVFGNPGIHYADDEPLLDNQRPLKLFLMGTKENKPALTMTVLEEGQYAVDFHAQLSTLQAFSICVAALHGTEATGVAGEERRDQLSHCNSLKMLIEEEVKFLVETVTEEEKRKASKKVEGIRQSYVLNPPFSPISRV